MANQKPEIEIKRADNVVRDKNVERTAQVAALGLDGGVSSEEFERQQRDFRRSIEDRVKVSGDKRKFSPEELRKTSDFRGSVLPEIDLGHGWKIWWGDAKTDFGKREIARRVSMGYTPVETKEVPDYGIFERYRSLPLAGWEGVVTANEMICFKVDIETYNQIMNYHHNDLPKQISINEAYAAAGAVQGQLQGDYEQYIRRENQKQAPKSWI